MKPPLLALLLLMFELSFPGRAFCAREVTYIGGEEAIYVVPGEPIQLTFPAVVSGGFKSKHSSLEMEKQDTFLVIFAKAGVVDEGEAIIVQLTDKRTYSLRVLPASLENPRDAQVTILDNRMPVDHADGSTDYVQPNAVGSLMRELVLVAEYKTKREIPGFKRPRGIDGETILNDGSLKVTIDEIFMGGDLWGYILDAENLLDTPQTLNPATFHLDGTKFVTAQHWRVAARPITAEQQIAAQHKAKVYVITRSKRHKEPEHAHSGTRPGLRLPHLLMGAITIVALILLIYLRWNSSGPKNKGIQ